VSEPADGATTRKNRLLDMLRYVKTNEPEGLGHGEIVAYLEMCHGLTARTGGGYVQRMIALGILRPSGQKVHLDEAGFQNWLEITGMGPPSVEVQCLSCKAVYGSRMVNCPQCGAVDRKVYKKPGRPKA